MYEDNVWRMFDVYSASLVLIRILDFDAIILRTSREFAKGSPASLRFLRPRRAPAAKSIGGPRLFWVMNALIYWQWGVNGGSGEIVDSITEKFSSRSVSPLESRSLPACLFVDLIAIYSGSWIDCSRLKLRIMRNERVTSWFIYFIKWWAQSGSWTINFFFFLLGLWISESVNVPCLRSVKYQISIGQKSSRRTRRSTLLINSRDSTILIGISQLIINLIFHNIIDYLETILTSVLHSSLRHR